MGECAKRYYRYVTMRTMTAGEVAKALGVQPVTVRTWAAKGKVPSDRTVGGHRRFSLEEVLASTTRGGSLLDHIVPFLAGEIKRWSVKPLNVTLFGSVARAEERDDSDVDLFILVPAFRSTRARRRFGEQLVELHFAVSKRFHRDLREVELTLEQLGRIAQGSAGLLIDVLDHGELISGKPLRDVLLPIVERMDASGAA